MPLAWPFVLYLRSRALDLELQHHSTKKDKRIDKFGGDGWTIIVVQIQETK